MTRNPSSSSGQTPATTPQNNPSNNNNATTSLLHLLHHSLPTCPITRSPLSNPTTLPCGHSFDKDAIAEWMRVSNEMHCPACQRGASVSSADGGFLLRRRRRGAAAIDNDGNHHHGIQQHLLDDPAYRNANNNHADNDTMASLHGDMNASDDNNNASSQFPTNYALRDLVDSLKGFLEVVEEEEMEMESADGMTTSTTTTTTTTTTTSTSTIPQSLRLLFNKNIPKFSSSQWRQLGKNPKDLLSSPHLLHHTYKSKSITRQELEKLYQTPEYQTWRRRYNFRLNLIHFIRSLLRVFVTVFILALVWFLAAAVGRCFHSIYHNVQTYQLASTQQRVWECTPFDLWDSYRLEHYWKPALEIPQLRDYIHEYSVNGEQLASLDARMLQNQLHITNPLHQKYILQSIREHSTALGGVASFHKCRFPLRDLNPPTDSLGTLSQFATIVEAPRLEFLYRLIFRRNMIRNVLGLPSVVEEEELSGTNGYSQHSNASLQGLDFLTFWKHSRDSFATHHQQLLEQTSSDDAAQEGIPVSFVICALLFPRLTSIVLLAMWRPFLWIFILVLQCAMILPDFIFVLNLFFYQPKGLLGTIFLRLAMRLFVYNIPWVGPFVYVLRFLIVSMLSPIPLLIHFNVLYTSVRTALYQEPERGFLSILVEQYSQRYQIR